MIKELELFSLEKIRNEEAFLADAQWCDRRQWA